MVNFNLHVYMAESQLQLISILFCQCKTVPTGLAVSPNGKQFSTISKDRKVSISAVAHVNHCSLHFVYTLDLLIFFLLKVNLWFENGMDCLPSMTSDLLRIALNSSYSISIMQYMSRRQLKLEKVSVLYSRKHHYFA